MRDNFKDLIDQHADQFEHSFDPEKGWNEFQKRRPKSNVRTVWMIAASVALLLSVGLAFMNLSEESNEQLSELEEIELFYEGQIDQMTQLVKNLSGDEEILYDLKEMDQAFEEVKADLNDDAASQEVIEAMMNHYRLKLKILERMLEEIKDDEKEDISML